MAKEDARGGLAFDDELSSVLSSMVRRAQGHERVGVVIAALAARDQVVEIQKGRMATTGNDATLSVTPQHLAAHRGWDVLAGTNAYTEWSGPLFAGHGAIDAAQFAAPFDVVIETHVGAVLSVVIETHVGAGSCNGAEVLSITARHLDDVRAHFDPFASSLLPASVRFGTDGHGDLVTGPTFVARASEHLTRHQQKCAVFIKRTT